VNLEAAVNAVKHRRVRCAQRWVKHIGDAALSAMFAMAVALKIRSSKSLSNVSDLPEIAANVMLLFFVWCFVNYITRVVRITKHRVGADNTPTLSVK
jgi:hypothetical protein